MKNYLIETFRDGVCFPFIGRGIHFIWIRKKYGLGAYFDVCPYNGRIELIIMIGIAIKFRSAGLNPKVYREISWNKYFGKKK